MKTYVITLSQQYQVPILADTVADAIEKAKEVINLPDTLFETDQQDYRVDHVAITLNKGTTEEATENEEIYQDDKADENEAIERRLADENRADQLT